LTKHIIKSIVLCRSY